MQSKILTNFTDDVHVVREKIFGPVISILAVDYEGQLVRRTNDKNFGFRAGVMARDLSPT